jgi:hypothetical protein
MTNRNLTHSTPVRMNSTRRRLAVLALLSAPMLVAACSGDDDTDPTVLPPTQVAVTALGATRARVSFTTSSGGADGYVIERAAGAGGGTFAQVNAPAQPATGSQVTFEDAALEASSTYRYRIAAVRGSLRSSWSNEVSVTTLQAGLLARDVTLDVTSNQTWYADTAYTLKGFIHVDSGVTLTIQPGTIIKGDFNTLGSSLFVLPGAKLNAIGTAANPIVFTSSRAAGQRQPGDWGGLIIVGRASISRTGVNIDIEGTGTAGTGAGSGQNYPVRYSGRNVDDDDSGELRYVRVEFAGFAPSNGNELNSFTFAAVGSGTKLSYLQSLAGLDDSFEWFGGAVDAHHLVSYESGDDHFDMSEGFRGRLQYLIAYQDTVLTQRSGAGSPSTDPQGIENDGCTGTGSCANGEATTPFTQPVVANFTLVGTGRTATASASGGIGMMLRRGTAGHYVNGIVARWPRAGVSLRDSSTYNRAGATATQDLATADLAIRNVLFVEVPTVFQSGGTSVQSSLDLAGNALINSAAALSTVLTAIPVDATAATTEANLDFRPVAGSAAASGGLATFTGKLQARAGTVVNGTSYLGAVEPGAATPWYAGWTRYVQQ